MFEEQRTETVVDALSDCYRYRLQDDAAKAEAIGAFHADYFAAMDLPAEFYLDTVSQVFQQHALPLGKLTVFGRHVDPRLLTVEGEL